MKLLLITTAFPPVGGSHVQRVLNLANYLTKFGHQVSVIGYKPGENYPNKDYSNVKEIDSNIIIKYVKEGILHRNLRGKSSEKKDEATGKSLLKSVKLYIKKIGNSRKKIFLIPDTQIDWFYEVKKMEKKEEFVKKYNPDVIISCSMPNTSHIVGYWLAKKYNKPLVMDYGDPWSFEISVKRNFLRKKYEMNLEKRILKYSSLAFFATKETKNLYCNFFPNLADKFHVFMMGYAPSNLDIVHEPTDEKLTMIYGGMLNPIHRNPAPFLSAVSKFENVDVLIRSTLTNDWFIEFKETINKNQLANTRFEGLVDFTTFMKELMSKDILILFGNSSPTQIAGKVFNYISTGKHILYIKNFSEDVYDPVEEILKEYNNVTVTNNEVTEIAKSISVLIDLKNRGKLVTKVNKDMEKYTWEKQIEHFSAKLNETFHI